MPQLIQPSKIIITKDGEFVVRLSIDLNININTSGDGIAVVTKQIASSKKEDDPKWEIPTFGPAPKVKFGKIEDKG